MAPLQSDLEFSLTLARLAPNTHIASVSGELDLHVETDLCARLWPLADVDGTTVIVALCGVPFIDSTALGVLSGLARRLRDSGGTLILANPDPRLQRLIELTGLLSVLTVEPNLARAVERVGFGPAG